ncbi:DUF3440 domain-containing protein [Streptomyces nanshensis]|uniref:Phosphoadenosine phosphosulfate reductase n=1 Tax=Streptomyces nanshensis TaxID=518642 RepID=A0A1E7L582_9ACTN|nr:DUF3440 domain-containing protein [Streptomyces nanshensis]OEV11340.1 phosphoadenosine phosphosulfate reductase [Streptomyces nanshensis]
MNVWEATQRRLERIFRDFDNIVLAFSGGKDSGVMVNATLDFMRAHGITRKITVLHLDYEGQYAATTDYVTEVMTSNRDLIDPVWICLPFAAACEVSMYQSYWKPWNPEERDIWVRDLPDAPGVIHTGNVPEDFPEYDGVWDYTVQEKIGAWLHRRSGAERTAVLVGIRTQESMHRHAALYRQDRTDASMLEGLNWTSRKGRGVYNVYPIFDWVTEDIWTANARFGWSYNTLYDLFHLAGVSIHDMRVASPFRGEGQEALKLYRVIEPETWAKLVGRVNGANFAAIYGGTAAMGAKDIKLPEGHTWKTYANFLLDMIEDEEIKQGYLRKLKSSMRYWTVKGGALPEESAEELRGDAPEGTEFLGEPKDNRKRRGPYEVIRFRHYPDDIPAVSDLSLIPTYKRLVITILRCDHACKYMGFGQTKREVTKRSQAVEKYREIL